MYSINKTIKTSKPILQAPRLLDQLRESIRYKHYSLRTERAYVYWVRWFIRFHGLKHPKDMGVREVEAFLRYLAAERKCSTSTHRVALSALLYLYKEVVDLELPWMEEIGRPQRQQRLPVVLTPVEVMSILAKLDGAHALLARLLYGTGMRLTEGLQLRVKDIDFDRLTIIVREGKGGKDRAVMMPPVACGGTARTALAIQRVVGTGQVAETQWRGIAFCTRKEISGSRIVMGLALVVSTGASIG